MKAMVLREYGQKLKLETVPTPAVGLNEALVKIAACAIGRLDNWAKLGYMGGGNDAWHNVRLPMILGHQIAGEVAEAGAACAGIQTGDRVVVHAIITCGKCSYCLKMMDPHCTQHTHIGVQADGGFAEYIKVPGVNVIKIPDDMSFENATMLPANIGCSWHMLHARARLKPLESVLVIGAGGGVGIHLIQLAKSLGARETIGVDVSEKAIAMLKELGVDHAIWNQPGKVTFEKEVMEVTDGKGVDVAVELISLPETLEATSRCMGVRGRMVIVGFHGGSGFNLDARKVLRRELIVTGSRALSRVEMQEAVGLLQQGMVKPVIGVRLPLEEANEGLEMDLANKVVGRAVLINAWT